MGGKHLHYLLFFLAVSLLGCAREEKTLEKPNVLLIVVDSLRPDYLGIYGFKGEISPAIDEWAQRSILFTNAFSAAPWTLPSLASLFTSTSPLLHRVTDAGWVAGLRDRGIGEEKVVLFGKQMKLYEAAAEIAIPKLPEGMPTLAEAFRNSGYRTAIFSAAPWLNSKRGLPRGFEYGVDEPTWLDECPFGKCSRPARVLMRDALNWFTLPRRKPFFAYMHFMDVHLPYECSREDFSLLFDSPSLGENIWLSDEEFNLLTPELKASGGFSMDRHIIRNVKSWKACYAGGVRNFDRAFRVFFQKLKESGLLEKTVIVFTSDHGEEFMEHGKWEHGKTLFDTALRVPLIISLPLMSDPSPQKITDNVSLLDLMPTLLALAGIKTESTVLEGRDLTGLLRKKGGEPRLLLAAGIERYPFRVAGRLGDFKVILDLADNLGIAEAYGEKTFLWQLPREGVVFNTKADPGERFNLEDRDATIVKAIVAGLQEYFQKHAALPLSRRGLQPVHLSPAEIDALKSLGYLK